jgi:hypothetical protein
MEDKRNILKEQQPFDFRLIKDNKAQITFHGKSIKTLQGKDYNKLLRINKENDPYQLQLFLAKITGQFKHGNEKSMKKSIT